jgi:hypothetical protein
MWVFIYILLVHWFADFILQTSHMAERKSSSVYYLTMHVSVYSVSTVVFWMLYFLCFGGIIDITYLYVFLVTFSTHWVTDFITSKQTTKFGLAKNTKSFFGMIGFDQWIHAVTLFATYEYIFLK